MSASTNRIKFLPLLLALVCCCQSVNAQGLTGQISGILTDPNGGVVPNAKIEVINEETARVVTVSSDSDGNFVVPQLLSGTYTLVVTASGFKRFEQKGIILTANERVAVRRLALEVGDFNQTVTVTAEAALIQTNSAERAGLISEEQIQNIALKGRDYMGLVRMLPGVVDTANREAPGWNNLVGVTVNGSRGGTLNLTLDGVSSLDTGSQLGPYLAPGLDAIGEVKVLLTNYQAEYGRSSGGTINVVIKNGTRDFHGGGFYFKRHEQFNANEFFNNFRNQPKPRYRFNYWGGNIGGPVIIPGTGFNKNRDKLFFFWSQEYLPRRYPTRQGTLTYPTALERAGDFSQSFDTNRQLIVVRDPQTGQPFPGNIIPANRIDPNGQKLLSIFPLPNFNNPANTFNNVFQSTVDQPRREEILRMDWNISSKTTFYTRGIQNYEAFKGDFNFVLASNVWPQFPIKYAIESRGLVSTLIHSFSPTLTNEFTFGINRALQTVNPLNQEGIDRNDRVKLGLALPQFFPAANPLRLAPNATFGGVTGAPQLNIEQRFPFFGTNNIWNYSDNVSWIKGAHNMKAGFYFEYTTRNAARAAAFNGTFNFDRNVINPLDTNHPFANALIGVVNAYTESNNKLNGHARYRNIEWFAQDNWKVTRRFTVDAGLRFYYIEPTYSEGDKLVYFDPSLYDPSKQPALMAPFCPNNANPCANNVKLARNPITGATAPSVKIGTFADGAGTPFQGMRQVNERVFNTPPIQLAPRIGFAYDLFGDGKTSIRGGIGIFYDRFNDDQVLQQVEQPPNLITATANFTTIRDLLATPLSVSPPGVNAVNPELAPTATYNFSFGIQRDIGYNTVLDVAYVGSLARHLLQRLSLNAVPYGTRFLPSSIDPTDPNRLPLPDNFLRPIKGYADIQLIETGGNSNYHSMQVQLNRRFSSSLSFGVSYTWSKAMTLVDGNNNAINPFIDRNVRNYGRAGFDRTHNFVLNYVYRLPSLSKYWDNAVSRAVFAGWELSGITSFISGAPSGIGFALVQPRDLVGGGGAGVDSRVLLVANPVLARDQRGATCAHNFASTNTTAQRTAIGCHLNVNSVLPPTAAGDFGRGNAAKDLFRLPGTNNWDISLFKNFNLGREGKVRMQYRLEMYNAFNHTQFTDVDTTARFDANNNQVNALFGSYTNAANARRIVMGLKLNF